MAAEMAAAINIIAFSDRDQRYYDAATGEEIGPDGIEDVRLTRQSAPRWEIVWEDGTGELRPAAFIGTVEQARAAGVRFTEQGG